MIGPDGQENIPHRESLLAYERVMEEVKQELASQGRVDEIIGSKVRSTCDGLEGMPTACVDHLLRQA